MFHRNRRGVALLAAIATAGLWGCQSVEQPQPGPVEAADQPITQRFRVLAVEQPSSDLLSALEKYADVTHGDVSTLSNYDAVLIDADAIDHNDIADHAAVKAALQNDKIIIVAEPSKAHNSALVHQLAGISSADETIALALDRIFDADGRAHFAIVYGPAPTADLSATPADTASAYASFGGALHDYVFNDKAKMQARVDAIPAPAAAKPRGRSSDSDGDASLAAPAGSLYRHVFVYTAPTTGNNLPYTWDWTWDKKYADAFSLVGITSQLAKQSPSHSVKNHWYIYHNDPNGGGDFAGIDTYLIILEQDCQFSPGQLRWTSGSSLGYFQDHFSVRNEAGTWSAQDPSQFAPRQMDLEATSPENVNQTTSVTNSHSTSVSETISVGVSADGLSGGASLTRTNTVGTSVTRDISDWGIINQSDPGTGNSAWIFHQQMPNDRYLGDLKVWNKNSAKQPPALSVGVNSQDMITVWTTQGLPLDVPLLDAYQLAFRTTVEQHLMAQSHVVANGRLFPFGGQPFPALFFTKLSSQQNWRVTLNDQFLNGE